MRSVTFQQLAGRAAAAIHGRLVEALGGRVTPEAALALSDGALRGAGLSGSKAATVRALATAVAEGTVPLEGVDSLADHEIIERLTMVRGIGRWTAEMFLIFQLRRPDVWPVDDLGVRRGYAITHRLAEPPRPRDLLTLGDAYRPWRSLAAWYCWRAVDTVLPTA